MVEMQPSSHASLLIARQSHSDLTSQILHVVSAGKGSLRQPPQYPAIPALYSVQSSFTTTTTAELLTVHSLLCIITVANQKLW